MSDDDAKRTSNLYLGWKGPGHLTPELPKGATVGLSAQPIKFTGDTPVELQAVSEAFAFALDAAVEYVNARCKGKVSLPTISSRDALIAVQETLPVFREAHRMARAEQAGRN